MNSFCEEHYADLKNALMTRGLHRWIAVSEMELDRTQRDDIPEAEKFEPLLGCVTRIGQIVKYQEHYSKIGCGGCYLCYLENSRKACACSTCQIEGWTWMDAVANEQLETARALNLIPPVA